jgi:hypothetical protein
VRPRTIFVDQDGAYAGEVERVFVPIYEGFLLDVNGASVTVTSVEWEILEDATTCRVGIAPTPAELLAD